MFDPTEATRRELLPKVNAVTRDEAGEERPADQVRKDIEAVFGHVWTTDELCEEFTVVGFMAPFCVVERKSDGQKGTLTFLHSPRLYYDFVPHTP